MALKMATKFSNKNWSIHKSEAKTIIQVNLITVWKTFYPYQTKTKDKSRYSNMNLI